MFLPLQKLWESSSTVLQSTVKLLLWTNKMKPRPVILDRTLSDLFQDEAKPDEQAVLVYIFTNSVVQIAPSIPLPRKFVYNDPPFLQNDSVGLVINCQTYPEHMGFIAGSMPLFYLDPLIDSSDRSASLCKDSDHVYSTLCEDQRPKAHCISSLSYLALPKNARIVRVRADDILARLPFFVDSDVQYELAAKRALAKSNLPTPKTEVLDSLLGPDQILDDGMVQNEVDRLVYQIQQRELPFIVKLQYSAGSGGTFLVRNTEDREKCMRAVKEELHRTLRRLNHENSRFHPASIIIQEYLPGEAVGISFFVTRQGRAIFLGGCRQLVDESGMWIGGGISYQEQDQLRLQNENILDLVAQWAHQKGYYGPFGIDVMMGQNGAPLVIDINPRSTGATPLCLLRKYFSVERRLHEAMLLIPIILSCTRETFAEAFDAELSFGQVVITSWNRVSHRQCSVVSMIVAAETKAALGPLIAKVEQYKLL
ncbi:hypothetical protein F1880_002268 [Penicillium rolfsii]|nr:hypothetical protein F1880_002268 [Penicillium rolfsii]